MKKFSRVLIQTMIFIVFSHNLMAATRLDVQRGDVFKGVDQITGKECTIEIALVHDWLYFENGEDFLSANERVFIKVNGKINRKTSYYVYNEITRSYRSFDRFTYSNFLFIDRKGKPKQVKLYSVGSGYEHLDLDCKI